jgi:hypothetical protein
MKKKPSYRYCSDRYEPNKLMRIPAVIFQFKSYSDLVMTLDEYNEQGKFIGVLKNMALSIRDVIKVHKVLKYPENFPTQEWCG